MNPEYEPVSKTRFETLNFGGKLVREGIYEIMKTEGDNPELISVEDEVHKHNVIRQKVWEEYEEFVTAGPEKQTNEAGDFLAAWELYTDEIGADEANDEIFSSFKEIMDKRGINFEDAESARRNRAARHGEFDASNPKVVRAVEVTNPDRLEYYAGNDQWQEIKI